MLFSKMMDGLYGQKIENHLLILNIALLFVRTDLIFCLRLNLLKKYLGDKAI
jgi:hypothetical protein